MNRFRSALAAALAAAGTASRWAYARLPSAEGSAAAAALAAALAAFMSYQQQQQSARDSIRPELILSDWRLVELRAPGNFSDISVGEIENIGVAPAFNVIIFKPGDAGPPHQITSTSRISVLRENEKVRTDTSIGIELPASPYAGGPRLASFEVHLLYSDSAGTRYRTVYDMLAADKTMAGEQVAEGISISYRHTELFR